VVGGREEDCAGAATAERERRARKGRKRGFTERDLGGLRLGISNARS